MSNLAETLERFRRGPEFLAMVLTGVYGDEMDFTPAPGKWSIRQIVAHVADSELVGAQRFRQVIAEDNPGRRAHRPYDKPGQGRTRPRSVEGQGRGRTCPAEY